MMLSRNRSTTRPRRHRSGGSWNALKSAYHAYSGLFWIVPRTPSLQLGIAAVVGVTALGLALRLAAVEIAVLVLFGTLLLAVEALNTSVEMLCDHVHPGIHPTIGKVKDVAAGATAITEVGGAIVFLLVVGPHAWRLIAG